jgi:hypothetical protein
LKIVLTVRDHAARSGAKAPTGRPVRRPARESMAKPHWEVRMKSAFVVAVSALTILAGGRASAAITVTTGSSVPSPALSNGLEGMPATLGYLGAYSEGGITLEYVGVYSGIATTVQAYQGAQSWYPTGGGRGYTRVTRTGGGDFADLSFAGGSGFISEPGGNLLYQVLDDGVVIASGNAGPLALYQLGWTLFRISGGAFDEVRLQGPSATSFSVGQLEGGVYDAFAANIAAGVPEPTSWAMMILGFGAAGLAVRSRRPRPIAP